MYICIYVYNILNIQALSRHSLPAFLTQYS